MTELVIDAITGHKDLSFIDCTAGYDQIQMALKDIKASVSYAKGHFLL